MLDTISNFTYTKIFASVLDSKSDSKHSNLSHGHPNNYNSTTITNDLESTNYIKGYDEIFLARGTGDAFIGGIAGKFLKGNVILYNKCGQRIHQSISNVISAKLIHISPSSDADDTYSNMDEQNDVHVQDDECYISVKLLFNGIFEISYIPHKSGLYRFHVLCNNKHIENSPFDIKISHGPAYGPNCFIEALEYDPFTEYNGLLIHAMDSENNAIKVGGDKFEITPLGSVKVISTRDLFNGKYLVTYSILTLYDGEKCQLEVKFNGLELKNSPFSFDAFVKKPQDQLTKPMSSEYKMLLQLKECIEKKQRIQSEHLKLTEQIQDMREECNLVYTALNKKIVYSLPVNLELEDSDKREKQQEEMRKEFVKKHMELAQRVEKIEQDKQLLVELDREIMESLRSKFKNLKEVNRKYRFTLNKMEKELIKETAERRKGRKSNDEFLGNEKYNVYYENYDILGCVPGIYASQSENKNKFKICDTKPDNPSSPAFWFVEGRFRRNATAV